MHLVPELFAAGLVEKIRAWSATKSGTFQMLVFFGVVAVIALLLFGWALIIREQPRRHHHRPHSKPISKPANQARGGGLFSRNRRKRRDAHRPVNPTLAETGGLPPPRDRQPPSSTPPPPTA